MNTSLIYRSAALVALALTAGCGGDDAKPNNNATTCDPAALTGCADGLVCETVMGGDPACFAPVTFQGKVTDALSAGAIGGARVALRDAGDVVVSTVALTDDAGNYALRVPAPRDASGAPVSAVFTLRADAAAYEVFPKAPRVAIPVDIASAVGAPPVVASAATDITMIPLPNGDQLGSIAGHVLGERPGGTLVVAAGASGIADAGGEYVVFNVSPGAVSVSGYAAGSNYDGASANVASGEQTTGIDLAQSDRPTSTVSGKLSIVNGGGASSTSVVLAVEETFQENAARGDIPVGLRVSGISGGWSIPGVPDGKYVVLAAFENDGLVRDPDTSIGGTQIVHITVSGADLTLAEGFKVTGALAVVSPGATGLEEVSGTPELAWEDDSSEDSYDVTLFDALGNVIWETSGDFDPGGSAPATVPYAGPALLPGMIYQLRAVSVKGTTPISMTEDLRGVFLYK